MRSRMLHRFIDEVEVKRCGHCERWLPLGDFCFHVSRWDGLRAVCRVCDAAAQAKYYDKNSDKKLACSAKWKSENPDRVNAANAERRALKKEVTVGPVTADDLDAIRAAANGECLYCGEPLGDEGQFDHILALASGGTHEVSNLVYVCQTCNLKKGSKPLLTFLTEQGREFEIIGAGSD